jgi:hypothetical protein
MVRDVGPATEGGQRHAVPCLADNLPGSNAGAGAVPADCLPRYNGAIEYQLAWSFLVASFHSRYQETLCQ